ncbi:N-acetylglucosamine regulated methyl-accepting chemotaxis protein [Grimontia indica]|uniref:N-acetylglucosamine regulated methyl-accepting chemotaxis protein n=1 Tax=Grimontia indica TaxID=1056512 RepID=R1IR47_9GAMM|nr:MULTISPECIES: methyl-accepting chemotaxis protein [Grimontia]EOD79932.1 N-acetylglucosamine regulated methyl-accepting chemotaxis protein [Grimontia indica]
MLRKLTVSQKLFFGFGGILSLLVGMVAFVWIKLAFLQEVGIEVRTDDVPEAIGYLGLIDEAGDVYRDSMGVINDVTGAKEDLKSNIKEYMDLIGHVRLLETPGSEDFQRLAEIEEHMKAYLAAFENSILPRVGNGVEMSDLVEELHDVYLMHLAPIEDILDQVSSEEVAETDKALGSLLEAYEVMRMTLLSLAAVAILLSCGIAYLLSTSITRRLTILNQAAQRIANGELSNESIEDKSGDELASLAVSVNGMQASLVSLISSIRGVTEEVHFSAKALSTISQDVVSGASMQDEKATLIATASEELSLTISEVANQGTATFDEAKRSEEAAHEGRRVIGEMVNSIQQVSVQMQEMSVSMRELGSHSEEIGNVIKVIQGIAEQTNLLALNAAIEAARAGEFGRGFAVVADEVRALAERTTQATQEVSTIIQSIQTGTQNAVTSTEENCGLVEIGVNHSESAVKALDDIFNGAASVQSMISTIATAADEQTSVTREIASDITAISDISSKSLDSAQQSADRIASLDRKVDELDALIGKFKVC